MEDKDKQSYKILFGTVAAAAAVTIVHGIMYIEKEHLDKDTTSVCQFLDSTVPRRGHHYLPFVDEVIDRGLRDIPDARPD